MATVYEAERADGAYRQRVALKVLRRGVDTEDLVRRFVTERQILSSLSHAHIARLLDGGSTPEGRPFLVMELVEGRPVTAFADECRLDVPARLRLFLQVADAVHAAHRQLVVHRDIKPSNILVDDHGQVKLLDFGIAKLLAGGDDAEHTQAGMRAMTPDYASPEQLRGGQITTATDVYQLGLLLRELLTGVRQSSGSLPNDASALRTSRLATRRSDGEPSPDERATARGTTAGRLPRLLAGDLDTIVAKALREEPEQRYASADELASDIRRHLAGLPIVAHPESRRYRMRKFVRRNPWGVAAAAIASVALVGYALTITVQSRRIAAERDRAERAALEAAEVTGFLVQLFESADPNESGGERVTARELLDRGADRIDRELRDDPARRAAMLSAMGRSYTALGLYAKARPMLERAMAEWRGSVDWERQAIAVRRAAAADLNLLAAIVARDDRARADLLFQDALALAEGSVGPADPLVGRILTDYAVFRSKAVPNDTVFRGMLRRAVQLLRAAPGDNRQDLANSLTASAYGREPGVALPLMAEALALRRALHGDLHSLVAASLSDLALATESLDPLAADSLMREALGILETLHGRRHATALAVMNNLAGLRRDRGAYGEAAPLYREVLALRRELYPTEERTHAYALYGLGLTLAESGEAVEGERHLNEALRILRRWEAPGSPLVSLTRAALGYAIARQHRFAEAEPLLTSAYREIRSGPMSVREQANAARRVVWMYHEWGRADVADGYRAQLADLLGGGSGDRGGS
jgi:serine/threonine-protein kinase